MITLYARDIEDFDNNGIGVLKDVISCTCTEDLNGKYELNVEYAINGVLANELLEERIIKAPVGHISAEPQLFRIKLINKGLKRITIYATHIFYDLADNFLVDVAPTSKSGNAAINWMLQRTEYENNFTGSSDILEVNSARYVRKGFVESLIGGDNSFINTWGGELLRNNKHFSINEDRGIDRGVRIIYGKNLNEINWNIDITGVITRVYPVGFDGIMIPELFIESSYINNYVMPKVSKREYPDVAVDEESGITLEQAQEQLREAVYKDFENGLDKPIITVDVNFVELSKTDEYKEKYSSFERIYLGDHVDATVEYLGLNEKLKVVSLTYDVLAQKNIEFELSNTNKKNSNFLASVNTAVKKLEDSNNTILESARQNATALIANALGGYVYKTRNELFIMDSDNTNEAQRVWRWNLNGLGYSSTGVAGPYELAMTSDGKIVANFITAGQMSIDRITGLADALNSLAIDIEGFKFDVQSSGGSNLIINSVGFADFQNWTKTGNVNHSANTELISNGSKSGGAFIFNNGKIVQRINVKADNDTIPTEEKTYYTFSTIIKKGLIGSCYFKVSNDVENHVIEISENEESFYREFEIKGLLPKQSFYDIEIYGSEDSNATFTDNMCNVGSIKTPYQQAAGEILNSQININANGVLVKSNVYMGNYTVMSPIEFAGYANVSGNIVRVFSLNGDTTEIEKLKAKSQMAMNPIKIIPRTTGAKPGWYWAKVTGGES